MTALTDRVRIEVPTRRPVKPATPWDAARDPATESRSRRDRQGSAARHHELSGSSAEGSPSAAQDHRIEEAR